MTPIVVVKGNDEKQVLHDVDLKGWLEAGWQIKIEEEAHKEPTKRTRSKKEE